MCWAKVKAFFTQRDKAPKPIKDEAALTAAEPVPAAVNADAWRKPFPGDYLTEGGALIALVRAREFALMSEEDQAAVAQAMGESVESALETTLAAGDERAIWDMALAVTDGVYQAAVRLAEVKVRASVVAPYMAAVCKPFYRWLQAHGMQVNYCTNCAFENMDAVWHEFPDFFAATGMVYICPQNMARQMLEHNGLPETAYDENREQYLNEAFFVMRRLQKNCAGQSRSYVCMDADGNTRTYQQSMEYRGLAGHLVMERSGALLNEAHQHFAVWYPEVPSQDEGQGEGEAQGGAVTAK